MDTNQILNCFFGKSECYFFKLHTAILVYYYYKTHTQTRTPLMCNRNYSLCNSPIINPYFYMNLMKTYAKSSEIMCQITYFCVGTANIKDLTN